MRFIGSELQSVGLEYENAHDPYVDNLTQDKSRWP